MIVQIVRLTELWPDVTNDHSYTPRATLRYSSY